PNKKSKIKVPYLRSLVQQEKAPAALTTEDIQAMLIPSSFKAYSYTMQLSAK
ncbi:hypothetical protein EJ02DRAFT_359632, partial [Clathrospora elynae]